MATDQGVLGLLWTSNTSHRSLVRLMYRLLIEDDEGRTTIVPLIRNQINIGREEGNTIRLTERNVSRRHARLALKDGKIVIEDLQSYNGVWINGTRVESKCDVEPGDLLEIGDYHLSIQEEVSEAERNARPSLPPEKSFDESTPPLGIAASASGEVLPFTAQKSKLLILNTQLGGQEFVLNKPEMSIGRTEDNDISIDHASVSRYHAKIKLQGDAFQLLDLGSANGIQVNGEEYGVCDLRWGDMIELGQVRLRFSSIDEPSDVAPASPPPLPASTSQSAPAATPTKSSTPMVAGLVVVLLLAVGGGVFFAMNSGGPGDPGKGKQVKKLPPTPRDELATKKGQERICKRAEDAFAQEEYGEALKLLNRLLAVRSDWKKAIDLKKQVLFEKDNLNHIEKAKEHKVEGDVRSAYARLGKVKSMSRYFPKAEKERKALKKPLVENLINYALRSEKLKKYREALNYTDEVLQLEPEHEGAKKIQARLKKLLNKVPGSIDPDERKKPVVRRQGSFKKRRRPRRRIRRRRPKRRKVVSGARAMRNRCAKLYKRGKLRTSFKCFLSVTKKYPKDASSYVFLGAISSALGRCNKTKGRNMVLCFNSASYYRTYLRLKPSGVHASRIRKALGMK